MNFVSSALNELCIIEESNCSKGKTGQRKHKNPQPIVYKSKNLEAERRRRQKLSDRLLTLRGLVPIITNMNKATIIEDAITYIKDLQKNVKDLSDQLLETEALFDEEVKTWSHELDAAKQMTQNRVEEDVQVTSIDGNRSWVRIIYEKRKGRFVRLMEAMNNLGLELTDTSVTTTNGAVLVSSCLEVSCNASMSINQTRELLLEILRGI